MVSSPFSILRVVLTYLALDGPKTNDLSRPLAPSDADQKAYLDEHNIIRSQHGALPLVWNQTLSDKGAFWAARCEFKHSGGTLGPFGENLAAGTGQTAAEAVKLWTDEQKDYDPTNPQPSHYTQVVWKDTQQVGCAVIQCAPGTIFPPEYGNTAFHICEYFPAGNIIGQFPENVDLVGAVDDSEWAMYELKWMYNQ